MTAPITLEQGSGTINTASALELDGPISGPGALTELGANTLILTANNGSSASPGASRSKAAP